MWFKAGTFLTLFIQHNEFSLFYVHIFTTTSYVYTLKVREHYDG